MKKYRIEYDREGCIGAAACVAVDEENWMLIEDGKADLKDSKKENTKGYFIREITEEQLAKFKEAAEACPVNVIHIVDLETGRRII
ncbi:MAG TPA: ferredoxin [Candidatus Nanoarchaeia archaeon]|nr:ferredoxin [Candidatus Nanoarchaeia archaeon]